MWIPLCHICLQASGFGLLLPAVAGTLPTQEGLLQQIAAARQGAVIAVPAETISTPLTVTRSVALRGVSPDQSILQVTADKPALSVIDRSEVTVEGMTIRWQLDTSEPDGPPTAVYVKDATLTLKDCRLVAPSGGKRCPAAVVADGFSKLTLENCTLEGFEFAVNVSGGAEAAVTGCLVRKPGHCGLSVFSGSKLTVSRCVIAESVYHGLRSTGGTLIATENLILNNKNRGIYLGNRSAQATIRGNVFLANVTGISGFAQTQAAIEQNLFLDSQYAAIDSRETCALSIDRNIFQGNRRGIVLYSDTGEHQLRVGSNTFWKNRVDGEGLELPADSVAVDPQLADPAAGRFDANATPVTAAGHGLGTASETAQKLWQRWLQESQ